MLRLQKLNLLIAVVLVLTCQNMVYAAVSVNGMFSSGMVLQQGVQVPVWGSASAGEAVTATFRGQTVNATAGFDGKWIVRFSATAAGGPFTMNVSGPSNQVSFSDVYVGEVWLVGGQSNTTLPLLNTTDAQTEINNSTNANLHLYYVPYVVQDSGPYPAAVWQACNPSSAQWFSALAYYFGKSLQQNLNVHVGIIHCSAGGTMAQCWMSPAVLNAHPEYANPDCPQDPASFIRPSGMYTTMLSRAMPYAIKGFAFYQGESNAWRSEQYKTVFPALIQNWRDDWGQGNIPFLYVQLAGFDYWGSEYMLLREAQLLSLAATTNTAMIVSADYGNEYDIHPPDKKPVGERLAIAARGIAYSQSLEYSGPLYSSNSTSGNVVTINFTHTGSGLVAKDGPLTGFTICGADQVFYLANAQISGNTVRVSSSSVPNPVAVRYGWERMPGGNLYCQSSAGLLPASPFRTDTFAWSTKAYFLIRGLIKDSVTSIGVPGVTVTLSGAASASCTSTAQNVNYINPPDISSFKFKELLSGTYTVTPSKPGYWFEPASRTYSPLSADQYDQDFVAHQAGNNCAGLIQSGIRLKGDLNDDCHVNWADVAVIASEWVRCMNPGDSRCESPWH